MDSLRPELSIESALHKHEVCVPLVDPAFTAENAFQRSAKLSIASP
jgi:hypothetical protein